MGYFVPLLFALIVGLLVIQNQPWFQNLFPEILPYACAGLLATFEIWVLWVTSRARTLKDSAGQVLLRISPRILLAPWLVHAVFWLVTLISFGLGILGFLVQSCLVASVALYVALLAASCRSPSTAQFEFCEQGILFPTQLFRWEDVESCKWGTMESIASRATGLLERAVMTVAAIHPMVGGRPLLSIMRKTHRLDTVVNPGWEYVPVINRILEINGISTPVLLSPVSGGMENRDVAASMQKLWTLVRSVMPHSRPR